MKTGIELIAIERAEQIEKHGRTIEKDVNENTNFELSGGAVMAINGDVNHMPRKWNRDICLRIVGKMYKERLIIAGALIAAELDRLQACDPEYIEIKAQETINLPSNQKSIPELIKKYTEEYELVTRAILHYRAEGNKDFEIALNAKRDEKLNFLFDLNRINGTVFYRKPCFNKEIFMCAYIKSSEDDACKGCINS